MNNLNYTNGTLMAGLARGRSFQGQFGETLFPERQSMKEQVIRKNILRHMKQKFIKKEQAQLRSQKGNQLFFCFAVSWFHSFSVYFCGKGVNKVI